MRKASVVVLGGGLSGMAAAYTLAREGWDRIVVLEGGRRLGGLAGSFERDGRFYPLGYHHILHRDRTLLYFLDLLDALPRVRWRRIRMLFEDGSGLYDLGRPADFLRFPLALGDKLRFVRLMARAFTTRDWSIWQDRSAAELVDGWGSHGVRHAIFDPLCRLKFERPSEEISAAWLAARLSYREGSAPLGYIPDTNWTTVLCDGLTRLLAQCGVTVRLGATVTALGAGRDRIQEAILADGERIPADLFVSTVPPPVYLRFVPADETPQLGSIRYTALISAVCATRHPMPREFYWMNLSSLAHSACGIFVLSALNPTIGAPGDHCVNFVTHLDGCHKALFRRSDDELLAAYLGDFRRLFAVDLAPFWTNIARVPMYSPVFDRLYRNPPPRSTTWRNVYFAGNYRTFPSVASTGTALASGIEAGATILQDHEGGTSLPEAARAFRLASMPRG